MIVAARTAEDYAVFADFFAQHGGEASLDLRALGNMRQGKLSGAIWFNGFAMRTCYIHATGIMTPELLRAGFRYIFSANIVQLFGPIAENNRTLLSLVRFLGFKELYRINRGWDADTDMVIMTLHKSQCRWLERTRSTAREKSYA